jgi:hypothetical protein
MGQPSPRLLSIAIALASAVLVSACAQGSGDGITPHADAHVGSTDGPDANFSQPIDARPNDPQPDAFVGTPDAFVDTTPDAGGGSLFCVKSSDCSSDSCCESIAGDNTPPGLCIFKFLNPVCLP